jgi:hypothetical protein
MQESEGSLNLCHLFAVDKEVFAIKKTEYQEGNLSPRIQEPKINLLCKLSSIQ